MGVVGSRSTHGWVCEGVVACKHKMLRRWCTRSRALLGRDGGMWVRPYVDTGAHARRPDGSEGAQVGKTRVDNRAVGQSVVLHGQ